MKLAKVKTLDIKLEKSEVKNEDGQETKKRKNRLPSDEYKDEIEPKSLFIDESGKIIVSVKRGGEFGLPKLDIRHYMTTDLYTGFTKKGINIPLEFAGELIQILEKVIEETDEKGLNE
jgi:hypothetical protein